ncbi:hypothetical protein RJ640_009797 [Escallonia rubra]|uniref:Clp R domain-containing protein n=1 Tax=Escallonia rubra TaxID=112253 RepID=A0AA88RGU3_9ASTE|nr:hypothetical protein RJ640_009797 [Escallonia rubra]
MRTGLSTIQQTLTPEAASVLNHSIAEAGRRNHGQTTPLHVAATLLASPTGFLRQACIRSHPNSSHPLQCRALELCFSVALDRLPTAQNMSPGVEPPISNALMAALKRAQAHQRRGCPEQQQQPLLAVKVELEQLIISILDDPSVSRVMREASFSSPAVKATIEQSLSSISTTGNANPASIGIGFRASPTPTPVPMAIPNRNPYLNPRLQQGNFAQSGNQRNEEVKRVMDILSRSKKRNPILVGESEPAAVIKELLRRIDNGEVDEGSLKNVRVISLEKELASEKAQIPGKIKELGGVIESMTGGSNGGGTILDLGDLKWLVEQPVGSAPGSGPVSEMGRAAVAEMGKLLERYGEGNNERVWLIGTSTCETYLRCQVYHPTMENDWDLQAVPIASRSPLPGMFPRMGTNGILSSSVGSLNPMKSFTPPMTSMLRRVSENLDPARRTTCCPQCSKNYEQELAKLAAEEPEKSPSEIKTEASRPPLPLWLQNAKVQSSDAKSTDQLKTKDCELHFKQKSQELQKKWSDTCLRLHPNCHPNLNSEIIGSTTKLGSTALPLTGLYNPNLLVHPPFQPKLQQTRNLRESLQLNSNQVPTQPVEHSDTPPAGTPGSPVRTELVLGPTKVTETIPEEEGIKDLLGCISSEPETKFNQLLNDKFADALDADSFKRLLKGLMEKAWWQPEAASAVATTVTQCKLGNGKRRGSGSKGNIWLLFTGPDRVGKKKMASVLSNHVCGLSPVIIYLGSRRDDVESDFSFRGKTALDRIAEAVRRNPFSVIMLEDFDEADLLLRGNIKRAMERGRLVDSHGREISLGNVIFLLTGNWSSVSYKKFARGQLLDERKLASVASSCWQLRLTLGDKGAKHRANWLHDSDRPTRRRKEMGSGLSLDLNQTADTEDDRTDGSHNTSDLTVDHEERFSLTSVPHELASGIDAAIAFKPVNSDSVGLEIEKTITNTFTSVVDDKVSLEVEEAAIEKILGGVWLGRGSLQEWAENVLLPTFQELKSRLPSAFLDSPDENLVVRLEPDIDLETGSRVDLLPSKITVVV